MSRKRNAGKRGNAVLNFSIPPIASRKLLIGASAGAMVLGMLMPQSAFASACGSFSTNSTVGSVANCTAFTWTGTLGGTVTNNGTLAAGTIGSISNYPAFSIVSGGNLGVLANTGLISGTINNAGTLVSLTNGGTIIGGINSSGSLGTIFNTGLVQGDVTLSNLVTIVGGSGATIGTFTGASGKGTITSSANLVFGGGNVLLNDNVNLGTGTLISRGTNLTIAAGSTITGSFYQTLSTQTLTTSGLTVTSRVTLAGGTIIPSFSGTSNYIVGTAAAVLYSPTGITNLGASFGTAVAPTGARFSNIGASGTTLVYFNPLMDYVGGALASISVGSTVLNGTSTIYPTALYIASTGSLGTLTNTGTIRGDIVNLSANDLTVRGGTAATVGTLTGYSNSIGTISNTLSNLVLASGNLRLNDRVNVGSNTIINAANLTFGTLGTVTFTGNFDQNAAGATLALGTNFLTVSGTANIAGTVLANFASTINHLPGETISLISAGGGLNLSSGTLTGIVQTSGAGINVAGTATGNDLLALVRNYYIATSYGTISNTGSLTATSAVYVASTGTLGAVTNSGVIQGNVINASVRDLTLIGDTGSGFGTFTGLSGTAAGTITNTASNVTLAGNIFLNDAINAGTGTVVADGGTIRLEQAIGVTGNYTQNGGMLIEKAGAPGGQLSVSGAASISNVNISIFNGPANAYYPMGLAGATPMVSGGVGSSYTSITVDSGITGLKLGGTVIGNSLWGQILNYYVGTTQASLAVASGTTVTSPTVSTLIYIAGSGTLGTLSNSGVIQGDINNLGTGVLNLVGGSGTTVGTFAGVGGTTGLITNTLSNVAVSAGNLLLKDTVNVGSNALVNSGASLTIGGVQTIVGNYVQAAPTGTLALDSGAQLVVTGAASISNGVVIARSFDALANHTLGEATTLVQGGAGSSYSGSGLVISGVAGLGVDASAVGNNLLAAVTNDYIGAVTPTFTNSASVVLGSLTSASAALFVAATGSVGQLTNTGTLNGEAASGFGIYVVSSGSSVGSIGTLSNSGLIAGRNGIFNGGVVGTIDNSGQILDSLPNSGIANTGTVTLVNNQSLGTIAGAFGIYNTSQIATVANAGLVQGSLSAGSTTAIGVANFGTINVLTNSGIIRGVGPALADGIHNSDRLDTLTNDAGGTISASGTIASGTNNLIAGVANTGSLGTLANSGLISVGGTIAPVIGSLAALTQFNALAGLGNTGTLASVTNSGTISGIAGGSVGDAVRGRVAAVFNSGSIASFVNNSGALLTGDGTVFDNYRQGTIVALTNAGTVLSTGRAAVFNEGVLGTLVNSGRIQGSQDAIVQRSETLGSIVTAATMETLLNTGTVSANGAAYAAWYGNSLGNLINATGALLISNSSWAVNNLGTIGQLSNSGSISGNYGVGNASDSAVINQLVNAGTISGNSYGVYNAGNIGTLANAGRLVGPTAFYNDTTGTIGTLVNTGAILGNIVNASTRALLISGGTATGTFTGASGGLGSADKGLITSTGANVTLQSGTAVFNDDVNLGSNTFVNGADSTLLLSNVISITGNFQQGSSTGTLVFKPGASLVVSGTATAQLGTIRANNYDSLTNYFAGGSNSTLISATGLGQYDVSLVEAGDVAGNAISGLGVGGSVVGNNLLAAIYNNYIGTTYGSLGNTGSLNYANTLGAGVYVAISGNLGTLDNSGTIASGAAVAVLGTLGNLLNSGTLSGLVDGARNFGSIGSVANSGLITGAQKGFGNQTSITAFTNTSTGTILGGTAAGLQNDTWMGTVTNAGYISSGSAGFANYGTLGLLTNSGSINGGPQAIYLDGNGSAGTIDNSGTITAAQTGIQAGGVLSALINSGYIGNATNAVNVAGTLGTLVNAAGGTISGNNALYITGSIGGFANSGVVKGTIDNQSANDLTITGGAAGTIGTLTGAAGIGTISNTLSNLVFASGNLLLNDHVVLGSGTLVNGGASVLLNSIVSVTGNYGQTSGTLALGSGTKLVVSGAAVMTGGTVVTSLSSTANYLAGQAGATLVQAGVGSSYSNVAVSGGTIAGLAATGGTSGTNLVVMGLNDYVGGTLGSIVNSGTISAANPIYVAATGSLGTLVNNGALLGSATGIANFGSINSILNGTLGSIPTHGTIVGGVGVANSGVIGTLTSYDLINGTIGAGVDNQGTMWGLGNAGTIIGQTAGLNNAGMLTIFQNAGLLSGTVGVANSGTIAQISNIGFGTLVGNIAGANTGVSNTGAIGTLANQGTISGALAAIASTGTIGLLVNAGTIAGNIVNTGNLTIAGGGTLGVFTGTGGSVGTISNTSGNLVFSGGDLLLNDRINVGSNTVVNSGSRLVLPGLISITGNYSQSSGTLSMVPGTGALEVSGIANLSGGVVEGTLAANGNYLVGSAVNLIRGGLGSSYGGATLTIGGVPGLGYSASTITTGSFVDLLVAFDNNYVGGTLASLDNIGTLGGSAGLVVASINGSTTGSLGTFNNSALINANFGVSNQGTIGTLLNSGQILAAGVGVYSAGTLASLGALVNTGTISGTGTTGVALSFGGSVGTITNSGLISGPVALSNAGMIGGLANTGTIAGAIINASTNALTISGGSGSTIGTLTGIAGGIGSITSTGADLVFAGGNLLLNDHVDATGHTLVNGGASLRLANTVSVTGNYSQSAGTLLQAYGSGLVVSGAAALTGGTIGRTGVPGTINLLAGQASGAPLIAGGVGSSYTGLVFTADRTGLEVAGSVGGNNLYLVGANDYVGGSIGTITNTGTITAVNAVYVAATGSLGSLSNTGTLIGSTAGIANFGSINSILNGSSIGSLSNGRIVGGVGVANNGVLGTLVSYSSIVGTTGAGVDNQGTLLALGNAGIMAGQTAGVNNAGALSFFVNVGLLSGQVGLANSGTIALIGNMGGAFVGTNTGVSNTGVIGTLSNGGTISGSLAAISSSGGIGLLVNDGTIAGNIINAGNLTIGNSGGTAGLFTGTGGSIGTITNTSGNLVFASGTIALNDAINVGANTVINGASWLGLGSNLSITGNYSQSSGVLALGDYVMAVSGVASISGAEIVTNALNAGNNYIVGDNGGTLVRGGAGSSYSNVTIASGITGLALAGGTATIGSNVNLVLAASNDYVGGTLGSINNTGTINGVGTAVFVAATGVLGTLGNSGLLVGTIAGIRNLGHIDLVANSGTATGLIGLYNQGTIGTVLNTGLLSDAPVPTAAGLNNSGVIALVDNGGTISGLSYGVYNRGSIGTLSNRGLIVGATAVYNGASGTLGVLANSGVLSGNIVNLAVRALTITGGAGTVTGTLAGGSISSPNADVVLAGGNLLLADAVSVGSNTFANLGSALTLAGNQSVTGNFAQTAGTLSLAGHLLSVSGSASITGGTVVAGVASAANYLAGDTATLVAAGAASDYTGALVSSGLAGLSVNGTTSGNNLLLQAANTYIGASYGTLSVSGTLANTGGGATALYIASSGSLGQLSNSGTITGNIVNLSANALTVVGGGGTFTGGSIVNTGADLIFASGAVQLGTPIDVGAHYVRNNGAQIGLAGNLSVTGNYAQTDGELGLNGHVLNVSGGASITGGTVVAGLASTANYLVGDGVTLVTSGSASNYAGVNVASGVTGLSANGTTSGNNLLLNAGNDYIGGSYGTLSVSGALANTAGGATALYIAASGSLGQLSNSGTITGNIVNLSANALTIVGGGGTFTGGTLTNTGANVVLASGSLQLDDAVNVGSNTLVNNGASVLLTSIVNVTGNYSQSAGTLAVGIGSSSAAGLLAVSGNAGFTGGTVAVTAINGANLIAGNAYTIAQAGSLSASGLSAAASGFSATIETSSTDLLLRLSSSYIGGSLDTLTNTGTIVAPTAVNIASSGSLGVLANRGLISGNVINQSSNALTITGGSGGTVGTFAGGSILSTGADLIFASGAVQLGTPIDVGTYYVRNIGAQIGLAGNLSVTGNYAQTDGALGLNGHVLNVSGAASITGGTVVADLASTANYLVGDGVTLVTAGAASNYAGVNVTSGLTGLSASGTTSGNNLLLNAGNDYIGGSYGTLSVSGSLANTAGGATALYIAASGSLGQLSNSGTITGNIVNLSANALTVVGGGGTFTGGSITSTGADLVFASGAVNLGTPIDVGNFYVRNLGAQIGLTNNLSVTGNFSQTAGALGLNGHVLAVSGAASITGGTVVAGLASAANYLVGDQVAVVSGGAGSNYTGATVASGLTGLSATGTASGNVLNAVAGNAYIGASYGTLSVSGSLANTAGGATALYVASSGSLGQLSNSGTITGNIVNVSANDLHIAGGTGGTLGTFTGGTIVNTGSNVVLASGGIVLNDAVNVAGHTLVNSGASVLLTSIVNVTGNYSQSAGTLSVGIDTDSASGLLAVSGTAGFTGGTVAVTALNGANLLAGNAYTIAQAGSALSFSGLTAFASGFTASLETAQHDSVSDLLVRLASTYIGGTIGTVTNGGTISAPTAVNIASNGSVGTLANSGVINGNVINQSSNALTIIGGTGGSVGSFTGGTISTPNANLVFASGSIGLGNPINAGNQTVLNIGADLLLTNNISVSGNFGQTGGTLGLGGNLLSVSGAASLTGGSVVAGLASVDNYIVGDGVTLVSGGAGSNFGGASVSSGLTGLSANGSIAGNNLLAVAANDYIGGSYGTLSVNGTLSTPTGGLAALYIAPTGSLGQLANSGSINGNIINLSSNALNISGGTGGTVGTFAGGTIVSSGANVVFTAGALNLGNSINAGGNTVGNTGAAIVLANNVSITGNFSQTGGTLNANGHVLNVTGAASITGGTVGAQFVPVNNYIVGDGVTLVAGGAGSNYTGATVVSGLTGLTSNAGISGNTLLGVAANDYIGGSYGTLSILGSLVQPIGGTAALYIASSGTLGGVSNGGTIQGAIVNLSSNDLVFSGGTSAQPGVLTGNGGASSASFAAIRALAVSPNVGQITNTASNVVFTGGVQLLNDNINVGTHAVINSGATLMVNNAINITGNYSQTAGRLVFGVTSPNTYGNIAISGSGSLTGGAITLVGLGGSVLQAGTYTIASANTGLTLSNLTFDATGYRVTGVIVPFSGRSDLVLTVAGLSTNYAAVGRARGGPAAGTGLALDRINEIAALPTTTTPAAAAFNVAVLDPLGKLTEAGQRVALTQLSPSQITPQLMLQSGATASTAIVRHQQSVSSVLKTDSAERDGALWGEFLGTGVIRDATSAAAGFSASGTGVLIGADWYASNSLTAGIAFSWANTTAHGNDDIAGSRTQLDNYGLTAYGVWRSGALSVAGQLGVGTNDYDQTRRIGFVNSQASARFNGKQYSARLQLGYDVPLGANFTLTPQYDLRGLRVINRHYTEIGAGAANLDVGRLSVGALTQEVGFRLGGVAGTAKGSLTPDLRIAWVHDYKNGGISTTSSAAGVTWQSTTGRLNPNGIALSAGVTLQQSESFSIRAEYNGDLRGGYQSHSGGLRMTWDF